MKHLLVVGIGVLLVAACAKSQTVEHMAYETSVDPGGCIIERVLGEAGHSFAQFDAFSSDGKRMVVGHFINDERTTSFILDLETGERTPIEALNNGGGFSPDDKMVVGARYVTTPEGEDTELVEVDLTTGEAAVIAPSEAKEFLPSYSPDGKTILFNSYRTGGNDIFTYDRESGSLTRWTDFDGYEAHAQFSPDGSKILFHRNQGEGDYGVFVIDVATGAVTKLTNEPGEDSYGSWSPDGSVIVFASDRFRDPGVNDLFLMDADGGNVRRLTDYNSNDAYPFFSPNGNYIYFNSPRELQGIYRIAVDESYDCTKADGSNWPVNG